MHKYFESLLLIGQRLCEYLKVQRFKTVVFNHKNKLFISFFPSVHLSLPPENIIKRSGLKKLSTKLPSNTNTKQNNLHINSFFTNIFHNSINY